MIAEPARRDGRAPYPALAALVLAFFLAVPSAGATGQTTITFSEYAAGTGIDSEYIAQGALHARGGTFTTSAGEVTTAWGKMTGS